MKIVNTNGIVIKSIKYSEQDKIITVLTRDLGRITVMAKGALRSKGNIGIVTRFLSCSSFCLFKGRNMFVLKDAEFITTYPNIELDIEKLTYCSHFADMMMDIVQEGQSFPEAIDHFLYAIIHMNSANPNQYETIRLFFELRSVFIMGYTPRLDQCILCDKEINEEAYFSISNDGMYCCEHKPSGVKVEIHKQGIEALRYIARTSAKNLYRMQISPETIKSLEALSKLYVESKLEKKYTKMDMILSLRPKKDLPH
ncbi:MAG TPA: DNA repair protein RecO [Clostridiales bacterium]|nr:DNA repair protein RecO [Clostridiales bacterium]